jgi:two-component system cell cycle sensor histidine kinase/response regulator CckA
MREVSCRATRILLEALDGSDVSIATLVQGLPCSLTELRDPSGRIDWDVFAELLARLDSVCGDRLSPEDIGARMLKVPSFDLLRRAGQLLVSPRQLYEVGARLVAPALFSNVIVRNEWLPSGRLVMTGELLAGYRESATYFRICHANAAELPRLLGLPASTIEEQVLKGRRARLVLLPPASHTLAARIGRSARFVGALGEAWRGVARQQRELEASIAALRTSRHEYQQLIERLPDGVMIHRNGVVRWGNAALIAIFGAQRLEDIVGRSLLDFVPPEDRAPIALAMRRAATNEVSDARHEYRVLGAEGVVRRIQSGTAQLVDFEGEPARLVVLHDVTEQHRLREQAAISDRLASIGALAAGVAHEVNNPLTYVKLSLEIASREVAALGDTARTAKLQASLGHVREGTDRVLGIVRDLKMLSRIHDEPSEAVDLPALLDSTLALAGRAIASKAQIVRAYGPTPPALATRGGLGQVFLNLLTNAADAIPEGAPSHHVIRVTTRSDAAGRAVVEITDSGCGIRPDIGTRVFDPFFTTKPVGSGTGLGLPMCHRIVTELNGEIAFESAPGATTFRVTFPAAPPAAARNEEPKTPPPSRPRPRVLVVDDEPALLVAFARHFADEYDMVTAPGARQALDILRDDERFDAVLADLMMADLTGIDLYEAVRENHPGLERRFLFMTGGVYTQRAQNFLSTVSNRCIEKPFDPGELLEAIDELVHAAAL